VIFQSTKNKTNFFVPNFDKNLGCYRLPPLKEISSQRFGDARKVEGFGVPRWLPPLKETFVGGLGLCVKVSTPGILTWQWVIF
jgi:hypothetical protein